MTLGCDSDWNRQECLVLLVCMFNVNRASLLICSVYRLSLFSSLCHQDRQSSPCFPSTPAPPPPALPSPSCQGKVSHSPPDFYCSDCETRNLQHILISFSLSLSLSLSLPPSSRPFPMTPLYKLFNFFFFFFCFIHKHAFFKLKGIINEPW